MNAKKKSKNSHKIIDSKVPDSPEYPWKECHYVSDDGLDNFFPGLFKKIEDITNPMKPTCGGMMTGYCKLFLPTGELFHSLEYTKDILGWKKHVEFGAKQLGLLTAEISEDKIILSNGKSYELSACRTEPYSKEPYKNLSISDELEVKIRCIDDFTLEIENKNLTKYKIVFETEIIEFFATDDSVHSIVLTRPITKTSSDANIFCVLNASGKIIWKKGPTPHSRSGYVFGEIQKISNSEFLGWYYNAEGEEIDIATGKTLTDGFNK
jgi:hypothetical protein